MTSDRHVLSLVIHNNMFGKIWSYITKKVYFSIPLSLCSGYTSIFPVSYQYSINTQSKWFVFRSQTIFSYWFWCMILRTTKTVVHAWTGKQYVRISESLLTLFHFMIYILWNDTIPRWCVWNWYILTYGPLLDFVGQCASNDSMNHISECLNPKPFRVVHSRVSELY